MYSHCELSLPSAGDQLSELDHFEDESGVPYSRLILISCPNWGEGKVILTKSKRKHFFSGIRPLDAKNYDGIVLFRDMKSFMR